MPMSVSFTPSKIFDVASINAFGFSDPMSVLKVAMSDVVRT